MCAILPQTQRIVLWVSGALPLFDSSQFQWSIKIWWLNVSSCKIQHQEPAHHLHPRFQFKRAHYNASAHIIRTVFQEKTMAKTLTYGKLFKQLSVPKYQINVKLCVSCFLQWEGWVVQLGSGGEVLLSPCARAVMGLACHPRATGPEQRTSHVTGTCFLFFFLPTLGYIIQSCICPLHEFLMLDLLIR